MHAIFIINVCVGEEGGGGKKEEQMINKKKNLIDL